MTEVGPKLTGEGTSLPQEQPIPVQKKQSFFNSLISRLFRRTQPNSSDVKTGNVFTRLAKFFESKPTSAPQSNLQPSSSDPHSLKETVDHGKVDPNIKADDIFKLFTTLTEVKTIHVDSQIVDNQIAPSLRLMTPIELKSFFLKIFANEPDKPGSADDKVMYMLRYLPNTSAVLKEICAKNLAPEIFLALNEASKLLNQENISEGEILTFNKNFIETTSENSLNLGAADNSAFQEATPDSVKSALKHMFKELTILTADNNNVWNFDLHPRK